VWPFQHEQNNSELWNLFPELLNWFFCLFFTHFGVELVAFAKTTFSGQGAVPTSTQSHPRLSLMPLQLSHLTDWKLLSFSKFRKLLHTVNYHHLSPKAELVRGHPVIHRAIPPWSCGIFICPLWGWISLVHWTTGSVYRLFWVLLYFNDTLLDRSDGWKDVIVMNEERGKNLTQKLVQSSYV